MSLFHSHHNNNYSSNRTDMQFSSEERYREAQKVTFVSVLVNLLLVTAQVGIGFFAKSQALIADGLHSLADLVCDFLVLFANHHSRKEADSEHPYGHHRIETATTFILGIILILVGLGLLWNGLDKLIHLHDVGYTEIHPIALITAFLTLLGKEGLFRYMLHVGNKLKSQMLIANAWHSRSDAASSLVVVIGVSGNLLGITSLDLIASLIVAVFIVRMGWVLGFDALLDLIDRGLDAGDVAKIRQEILAIQGVEGIHELKSRKMGDHIIIDVHVLVKSYISVSEGHYIAECIRHQVHKLKDFNILDIMVHIDPEDDLHIQNSHLKLPSRQKIEQDILIQLLQLGYQQECLNKIVIHYLSEELHIEIILNHAEHFQLNHIDTIKKLLPYVNYLNIYTLIATSD